MSVFDHHSLLQDNPSSVIMSWSSGRLALSCCLYLLVSCLARALVDKAENFDALSNYTNIILAPEEDADVRSVFGGDSARFTRDIAEPGRLEYFLSVGINNVRITVFTKNDPDWELEAVVGGTSVLTLTAENVTSAVGREVCVLRHREFMYLHMLKAWLLVDLFSCTL